VPEKVERCVRKLLADPKFKPKKGRTKEESAWAICNAAMSEKALSFFGISAFDYIDNTKTATSEREGYNLYFDSKERFDFIRNNFGWYCTANNISLVLLPEVNIFRELKDHIMSVTVAAKIVQPENLALAQIGLRPQPDLMYVVFKLMHVGVANNNKDLVTIEDARERVSTAVLKPIDWEHSSADGYVPPSGNKKIIGVMFASDLREGMLDEAPYIEVAGGIYEKKFSKEAAEMRKRAEENRLLFSFEIPFESARCSICEETFALSTDYCEHLNGRLDKDSSTNRILQDWYISGAGVVREPADEDASHMVIATSESKGSITEFNDVSNNFENVADSSKTKGGNEMGRTYSEEEFNAEVEKKVKELVDEALAKIENGKAVEELKGENETLATKIQEFETKVTELESTISTLTEEKDKAITEFEKFKVDLEEEAKATARFAELEKDEFISSGELEDEDKEKLMNLLKSMGNEDFEVWKKAFAKKKEDEVEEGKTKKQNEVAEESQKTVVATDKSKKVVGEEVVDEDPYGLNVVRVALRHPQKQENPA